MTRPTEEELAAVLAALRLRAGAVPGGGARGPARGRASERDAPAAALAAWRRRRLAAVGQSPRAFALPGPRHTVPRVS